MNFCPYCQTTGWPEIKPCRCYEFAQAVHAIQSGCMFRSGPHRIEECVIPGSFKPCDICGEDGYLSECPLCKAAGCEECMIGHGCLDLGGEGGGA